MNEAMELLRELAEKLGQTVESLWPSVVRYYAISAIVNIAVSLGIFAIVSIVLRANRQKPFWIDDNTPTLRLFAAIVVSIAAIFLIGTFLSQMPIIIEPTGYAVDQILHYRR